MRLILITLLPLFLVSCASYYVQPKMGATLDLSVKNEMLPYTSLILVKPKSSAIEGILLDSQDYFFTGCKPNKFIVKGNKTIGLWLSYVPSIWKGCTFYLEFKINSKDTYQINYDAYPNCFINLSQDHHPVKAFIYSAQA